MHEEWGSKDITKENNYKIIIKDNGRKTNIRLGTKILLAIVISTFLGTIISQVIIKFKYGDFIATYKKEILNNEMVINDYTKIINLVEPSLVSISKNRESLLDEDTMENNSTGVVIDNKGSILTAYSIVDGVNEVFVRLNTRGFKIVKGKVVIINKVSDVAIIKIEYDEGLQPIKIAESDTVHLGQEIVVLGDTVYGHGVSSITKGIITSKYEEALDNVSKFSLIEISAPINKTNNGGPICNSKGELIGLASFEYTEKKDRRGIYQGIELRKIKNVISSENIFKKSLGIEEGGLLAENESEFKGFYVERVTKGGSAYLAGIKPTDIIIEVDNNEVNDLDKLNSVIGSKVNGDVIKCKILSDGVMKEVNIRIVK